MAVKGLKLLVSMRFDSVRTYPAGEYRDNIPEAMLAEFENGSKYIEELPEIPSVKKASAQPIAQQKTVEAAPPPKRTPAKKPAAKTKTAPKK